MRLVQIISLCAVLVACAEDPSSPVVHASPATAEPIAHEAELLRLTLTPASRQRLGIETVRITERTFQAHRQVSGEIVVPPLVSSGVPTGSTTNFQQLAALQVAADADVEKAQAQVDLAQRTLNRARVMMREEVGSQRAIDESVAALATAQATLTAAQRQRDLLGPTVDTLNRQSTLWVRASVFSADLDGLNRDAAASVSPLGERSRSSPASPVEAPPSANSAAGTVDIYYELADGEAHFFVGQRVAVDIRIEAALAGPGVPIAAVVRDIYGGEWAYQNIAPDTYVRRRIEVAAEQDGHAILGRGLAAGDEIVAAGAAELFGIEFGAAH